MVNRIYNLVGQILETAQYIEWNIALIVCKSDNSNTDVLFEKMQEMTLGQIKNIAENCNYFEKQDIAELEHILNKRNYLVHQFFKKNDIVKHRDNSPFLQNKVNELCNIFIEFNKFNNKLSNFYKSIR